MSIKKTVVVTNRQQLIDLNGETTNFDLNFNATAKDKNSEFEVVVVDQNTLDNNPELDFRKTSGGTMSANIISDKNIYQNYFLCLRAAQPTEVDIIITKKEIPPNSIHMEHNSSQPQYIPQQHIPPQPEQIVTKKKGYSMKKIFLIIIIVAGVGFLLYYYFFKKKLSNNNTIKNSIATAFGKVGNNDKANVTNNNLEAPSVVIDNTPQQKVEEAVKMTTPEVPTVDNDSNFKFKRKF